MNHLKANPVGIDKVIDRIQKLVHDPLLASWGSLDVYGRAYKIKVDGESRLKLYKGNGEYEPILFSEGNKIFFVQGDNTIATDGRETNDLFMVCVVKLDGVDERKDEEVHNEVVGLVSSRYLKQYKGLRYGMGELKKLLENDIHGNFKFGDIHPYHVFIVKFSVNYYLTNGNPCSC